MNQRAFYSQFTTEKECVLFLKSLLEQGTVCCNKCGNKKLKWNDKYLYWRCKCMSRISVKSKTFMKDSNISLLKWFEAIYIFVNRKKPCSDLEFSRIIGVKRYRTVRYLLLKIRKQMSNELNELNFENVIKLQMDENYTCEMLICKSKSRKMDKIKLTLPEEFSKCYSFMLSSKYSMKKIVTINSFKVPVLPVLQYVKQKWKNILIENYNRIINGLHHGITNFHTQLYLDEYAYKYNHRYCENQFEKFMDIDINWQQSDYS